MQARYVLPLPVAPVSNRFCFRFSHFQGEYIDVWQHPDGTIELRANGTSLPFITYNRLGELDQGAIVDNKRPGRALEMIKLVQDKRDNTRSQALPSLDGQTSRKKKQP